MNGGKMVGMLRLTLLVLASLLALACSGAAFEGSAEQDPSAAGAHQDAGLAGLGGSAGVVGTPQGGSGSVVNPGSRDGGAGESGGAGSAGVSASGSAGAAGIPTTSGGAGAGPCVPLTNTQDVCAGKECGHADDGCGRRIPCGSVTCWPDGNGVARECVASKCAVTCASDSLQCGGDPRYPALGCGGCDAKPGGQCGIVERGACAYCADAGPVGICPDPGYHVWALCGAPPSASCTPLESNGNVLPNQWCCPP